MTILLSANRMSVSHSRNRSFICQAPAQPVFGKASFRQSAVRAGAWLRTRPTFRGKLAFRYQLGEIGGEGYNHPGSIAIDLDGGIWITGFTNWKSFPIVKSELQDLSTAGGGFLAKLNSSGSALLFSMVNIEQYARLVTDPAGHVHAWTLSEPRYGPLILRSEDSGATWDGHDFVDRREPLGNLRFSPRSSAKLFATVASDLILSQDQGRTWRTIINGGGAYSLAQFALHPANPDTLFAASGGIFSQGEVRRSTDGGATWKLVWANDWGTSAMLVDPASTGRVYASECSYRATTVARLDEGGNDLNRSASWVWTNA